MKRGLRSNSYSPDDATSLAGWVFADLLLSLSIIFLTSISFAVPGSDTNQAVGNGNVGQLSSSLHLDNGFTTAPLIDGFNFYYKSFDKNLLERDLQEYFKREGLSPDTDVIYAQLAGGYDKNSQESDLGTMTALKFSIQLNKSGLAAFKHSSMDLLTTDQLPSGVVALRLTFVPALGNIKTR